MLDRLSPRIAAIIGFAVSALLLAGAHAFEAAGYEPCALCLDQREVHWTALAIAAVAFALTFNRRFALFALGGAAILGAVYLWSTGLAVYHAGVEWKFWPAPPCEAMGGMPTSGDDLLASLSGPSNAVPCDEAAWRLFGISMAGYNAVISLGLAVLCFTAVARPLLRRERIAA